MLKLFSIADFISIINALFGFLALIMIYNGELRLGFSFILLAVIADGMDGIVARKGHQSKTGEYLESMADMTSLGIAPTFFVYHIYSKDVISDFYLHIVLVIILLLFLSFNIVRLSSFHIMKNKDFFVGLPASASTIILIILSYFQIKFWYILLVTLFLALLMISNLRFPKPDVKINLAAGFLILLTLGIDKSYYSIAPLLLLLAICIYVFAGPIFYVLKAKKHQ